MPSQVSVETCTFHTEVVPTGLFAVPRVLIAAVLATMEQDSFAATGLLASALPAQHKGTRTQAQPWSHVFLVSGECGSVSSQQKFEAMDIKALSVSQLSDSVTAPSYSSVLFRKYKKIHPRGMRACRPKRYEEKKERKREKERKRAHARTWEREREHVHAREKAPALWLLFLYVFSFPWACPM